MPEISDFPFLPLISLGFPFGRFGAVAVSLSTNRSM
jgi:hypothetical protein